MTTYAGTTFEVATIGGNTAYGATMTKYAGFNWKLHEFGPGGGMGAPSVKPVKIKKLPMLTLSGKLCAGITSSIITACGLSAPDFSVVRTGPAGVTCTYGGPDGGFSTTSCVGTRLTISGTSNEIADFSLDMFGAVTSESGAVTASGGASAEFFPLELGTGGAEILGFTLTVDTGFVPVFGMSTQGPSGWVNLGDVGATCTLQLIRADPTGAFASVDAVGVTNSESITLVSPGGASLGIGVTGYYSALDRAEVQGILCTALTLTGFGASMVALS